MKRAWFAILALTVQAGLLVAVLFSASAVAQEDDIEAAIGQSRSGATIRELQAQANAQPPKTDDQHELAIFYHKRGVANIRLGNYARAVEDLRLALENNQPNRLTPEGWGDRIRIQSDLANAYSSRGDWFAQIDLWNRMAQEYQQSDLFYYYNVQLRLMSAYSVLGQWAEADKARQEADATLPRLRSTRGWATRGSTILSSYNQVTAGYFWRQGNYLEAERRLRASVEWAEKSLDLQQRIRPKGDQWIRTIVDGLRYKKISLANNRYSRPWHRPDPGG